MVASLGAQRPIPNRSRAVTGRSRAHSATATHDRAPANTAATAIPNTVTSRYRRPRAFRGSGTSANAANKSSRGSTSAASGRAA